MDLPSIDDIPAEADDDAAEFIEYEISEGSVALDAEQFAAALAPASADIPAAPLRDEVTLVQIGELTLGVGQIAIIQSEPTTASGLLTQQVLGLSSVVAEGVALWGHPVARLRPAAIRALRQRVGVVPQRLQLLDKRSVFDNVALPLEIDGVASGELIERTEALLADFDLAKVASRAVGTLSFAMQQRVAFARACVRHPELVLADQPTLHQDEYGAMFVADQLELMRAHGAGCMIISNDERLLARARREGWAIYQLVGGMPVLIEVAARGFDIALDEDDAASPSAIDAVANFFDAPFSFAD